MSGPGHVVTQAIERMRQGRFSYGGLLTGLYAASFCIRASFGATLVLLSAYLPTGNAVYGFVIATTPLAELVAVPFVGLANDIYGRRSILLGGLGLAVASEAGRVLTDALWANLLFNAMHGVAAALILVTSLALLADWAQPEHRGREMGAFDFVNLFGWMVGFAMGLILTDVFAGDLRLGFIASSGFALAGLAVAYPTVREPAERTVHRGHASLADLARLARDPKIALVVAPWLIIFVLIGSLSTFLERLVATLGFTGLEAAIGVAVFAIVLLASQLGYGRLSDRYGRTPLLTLGAWGFFVFTIASAMLVLEAWTGGGVGSQRFLAELPAYSPVLAVSGLAMLAFGPAALAALADVAEAGTSGLTMSLYSLVVTLGFVIGPILTGSIETLGGATAIAFGLIALGGALLALVTLRNRVVEDLVDVT